jgi:cellulose synthase/poly-beta-1,6-N-acetylglucosamine synthase-like glycosyltransferase
VNSNFVTGIWIFLGTALMLLTLPGSLELCLLTLGSFLPGRPLLRSAPTRSFRIAIVVPAHDEHEHIERCIHSLLRSARSPVGLAVVVVADNCADDTAALARKAGARVLERNSVAERGKGYALDFAFKTLLAEGFDGFIVIDADSEVDPNLVATFTRSFASGAEAIQCAYLVNNPESSLRARLMNTALLAFNSLRPRGRDRLGLSAGILGNGFGLSRETLLAVPYEAGSVVEDLEYHLKLVKAGRTVWFADETTVRADMPAGGRGARTQRARWEGGRLQMLRRFAPGLTRDLLRGETRLFEPLLDLLLQPLAFHGLLLLVTLAVPFFPTRVYAVLALGVMGLHVLAAIFLGGGGIRDVAALAVTPFYVLWKLALLPKVFLSARDATEWVRTERAAIKPEG